MYINTITGAYPLTELDIKVSFPTISFASPFIPPEEYAYVFPHPKPEHAVVTQIVQEINPVLTNKGHWEQRWEIIELFATQEERDAAIAADAEARRLASVPRLVSRRQGKQALALTGKLALVQPAINNIEDPLEKQLIQIEWDDSQEFERDRPSVIAIGTAVGLNSLQLDELFILAATL
jgi:hypothetical protein